MASSFANHQRNPSDEIENHLLPASEFYGQANQSRYRNPTRTSTFSTNDVSGTYNPIDATRRPRRGSHDEHSTLTQRFQIEVKPTLKRLLAQEDTNNDHQITIEDKGPKEFALRTSTSNGHRTVLITGNYSLSNLLQELTLASYAGLDIVDLPRARLNENPVERLDRLIKHSFWHSLTRRIDGDVIEKAGRDPKDWTADPRPRIYIPHGVTEQFEYYIMIAKQRPELRLDVLYLPKNITPESVRDMNDKPGLLALAMDKVVDEQTGEVTLKGVPFVVPGGRFNELYGWDSYMESLGLIVSGHTHLAKAMVRNFCFCIEHYGKILNANRSYYLCRSQPPFLTDMALRVYDEIKSEPDALDFLRTAILAAIKEYHSVWMCAPRLDPATGLSRYRPEGLGVPPETEASHFDHILTPYAKKNGMTFQEFVKAYNERTVSEPELDEYFLHDRAVRESGHDTSYRLEGVCANLATIDLNSLLYKYETDIGHVIEHVFGDKLAIPAEFCVGEMKANHVETSALWTRRARARKAAVTKYMWNEKAGMFMDYNTVLKKQCTYESATSFWALWAKVATPAQAQTMVTKAIPKLEAIGGLLSGTEVSRGQIGLDRPNRQWDFPYGWAPQQILAWKGLENYGFKEEAQRLAYRWCFMVTKAFIDFNGVVVEKYDVTRPIDPHRVDAEYGNQGLDFKGVAQEGFGWVNASYVLGLKLVGTHARRSLGAMSSWEVFEAATLAPLEDAIDEETEALVV